MMTIIVMMEMMEMMMMKIRMIRMISEEVSMMATMMMTQTM